MNITIVRMVIGILLLLIPALILFRFDRRFLRQSAVVLGRLTVTLLVLAGCLYYIFQWDKAWVNILWVLLTSGVATTVYCRKRWQSVPIYISMTVMTFIMGIVVLLLMDVPSLFSASYFLPVMTMLQAEALFVCRRGITTYVLERRTHKELFEYLRGNGANPLEALRPFLTKLASALTVAIANITYIVFNIIHYTNGIADLEQAASAGEITAEQKAAEIDTLLSGVQNGQSLGLLLVMTVLPCVLMFLSYILYQRKYKLDEEEYSRICEALAAKKA